MVEQLSFRNLASSKIIICRDAGLLGSSIIFDLFNCG
jgi:hypothetical protein